MTDATFAVTVRLDPVPGAMHTEDGAREALQAVLDTMLPSYQPVVMLADAIDLRRSEAECVSPEDLCADCQEHRAVVEQEGRLLCGTCAVSVILPKMLS